MNRAPALAWLLSAAAAWGGSGCGLNQEGVQPPKNTFFYPASAALDTSGNWLFVANSNADLRYNDGTLVMVNVGSSVGDPATDPDGSAWGAAEDRTLQWPACPQGDYVKTPQPLTPDEERHNCCWDRQDPNILNCDERAYIPKARTVRIGSFAAGMIMQTPCAVGTDRDGNGACACTADPGQHRLFVAVRGNTSLTYVDVDEASPPNLNCTETKATGTAIVECDASHRIIQDFSSVATFSQDGKTQRPVVPLPNEPYALAIDQNHDLLYVGHLTGDSAHAYTGGFSLFDIAPEGRGQRLGKPTFVAPFPSPFPANASGLVGVTSLYWVNNEILATSRFQPLVQGLAATVICDQPGANDISASSNGDSFNTGVAGAETRGIRFDSKGNAFVLQRTPPALVAFDSSRTPIAVLETCSSPTFLEKTAANQLLVNCYDTGEVYVFDPSVPRLVTTFQVGRGPAGFVLPPDDPGHGYIIGFGDNNISVIDLDPDSPTAYHMVQRIGFPQLGAAMKGRAKGLAVTALVLSACSQTPNILPTNDFNRPTDVAFMCLGGFGTGGPNGDGGVKGPFVVSGRPMRACHPPGAANLPGGADPGATITTRTFAFMTNSGSGELSVIDANGWRIVDLDPASGGYGRLPLGSDPEQISVSDDGCRLVSANRGSCDLTLVDPSVLLAPALDRTYGDVIVPASPKGSTRRVIPHRADGTPLGAAPYEVFFLPQDTADLQGDAALCGDAAQAPTVGFTSTPSPSPWKAVVTFPSCDLIALVDLPSGAISESWHVEAGADQVPTLVPRGSSPPACPLDCRGQPNSPLGGGSAGTTGSGGGAGAGGAGGDGTGGGAGDGATAGRGGAGGGPPGGSDGASAGAGGGAGDGSAGAGGGTANAPAPVPVAAFMPTGLAIAPPVGRDVPVRAYVGLASSSYVMSFDLVAGGGDVRAIGLYGNPGGTHRIRLSVNPYPSKTEDTRGLAGRWVGDGQDRPRQFLYVIAHDGSLRIVDVFSPLDPVECETTMDPRLVPRPQPMDPVPRCIPVKVDPVTGQRLNVRPLETTGPGVRLPSVPVDIAAVDVRPIVDGKVDTSELTVGGAHAWVLTASGTVYLVNIDPVVRTINVYEQGTNYTAKEQPEPVPYVNIARDRNQLTYSASLDPTSGPPRVPLPPATSFTGPFVESFLGRGTHNNAMTLGTDFLLTPVHFEDPTAVTPQTWTVTWQGLLVGGRYGGKLVGSTLFDGANFCGSGVLAGDLLTFTGCTADAQCIPGLKCQMDPTVDQAAGGLTVSGLCAPPDLDVTTSCPGALQSLRRYEIAKAYDDHLELRPHLDELLYASLTTCETEMVPGGGTDGGAPDGSTDGGAPDGGGAGGAGGVGGTGGGPDGGTCTKANVVVPGLGCADPNDPLGTAGFKCMAAPPGWNDDPNRPAKRCLKPCVDDGDCRNGRICLDLPGSADSKPINPETCQPYKFCSEAPALGDAKGAVTPCLAELVTYNVAAGGSYLVSGSQTGSLAAGKSDSSTHTCVPLGPDERDWRMVSRIPIGPSAVKCTGVHPVPGDPIDHACDVTEKTTDANGNQSTTTTNRVTADSRIVPTAINDACQPLNWLKVSPVSSGTPPVFQNPCLFMGGSNTADGTDLTMTRQHVRARFENPEISFVIANVDREPSGGFDTHFDVAGGARPQFVQYPSTVEVSMPTRLVLGPIDSLPQTSNSNFEAPYLFVVDQRRLGRSQGGGATRGQLLRINPIGFAATLGDKKGIQPTYEDYTKSGNLFPIQ